MDRSAKPCELNLSNPNLPPTDTSARVHGCMFAAQILVGTEYRRRRVENMHEPAAATWRASTGEHDADTPGGRDPADGQRRTMISATAGCHHLLRQPAACNACAAPYVLPASPSHLGPRRTQPHRGSLPRPGKPQSRACACVHHQWAMAARSQQPFPAGGFGRSARDWPRSLLDFISFPGLSVLR